MCGRARLSSDVSDPAASTHPEHRAYWQWSAWQIIDFWKIHKIVSDNCVLETRPGAVYLPLSVDSAVTRLGPGAEKLIWLYFVGTGEVLT